MESPSTGKRWSLAGATALVTGGTSGIGFAIVEELVSFGATVHTCGKNAAQLERCIQRWKSLNYPVTGSICDVTSRAQRQNLMAEVSAIFGGKLNILVNNAGTAMANRTIDVTAEEYSKLMTLNLESSYNMCQLAYPLLKASEAGSIIFISSIGGRIALPNLTLYGMSKGAMDQLTRSLACEWAKDNIRANCVAPGAIKTPLLAQSDENAKSEAARTPLGRNGTAEEVAALAVFLCLPAASYVSGQTVYVDGARSVNG